MRAGRVTPDFSRLKTGGVVLLGPGVKGVDLMLTPSVLQEICEEVSVTKSKNFNGDPKVNRSGPGGPIPWTLPEMDGDISTRTSPLHVLWSPTQR